MKKWIVICLLFCTHAVQAEEVYLEGISLLGSVKKAYVVVDEVQMLVEEGDELGQWFIQEIQQRAIVLTNSAGEEQILALYSKFDVDPAMVEDGNDPFASGEIEGNDQTSEILQKMPQGNPFAPKAQIPDDEVPEGKRKVSTPFGDFLVDDVAPDPEQTQLLQQTDEKVGAIFEQAPDEPNIGESTVLNHDETDDHPVIRTPFGDLPVKTTE